MNKHLTAFLGLDKTGFDAGLKAAGKEVSKFGGDIKKTIAGAFGVVALKSLFSGALQATTEITKLSNQFSLTTDEVQLLQQEATRTGRPFSDLVKNADELESTLARIRGGDVIFTREQIEQLNNVNEIIGDFKSSVGAEFANIIKEPSLLPRRMLYPLLGTDINPEQNQLTNEQNQFLALEAARKRAEQERKADYDKSLPVLKQANELAERNRISLISKEERLNELAEDRKKIFDEIAKTAEERAAKQLRLAQNESELIKLSVIDEPVKKQNAIAAEKAQKGFSISENSLGRIGAFSGAAGNAAVPPGQQIQIQELQKIRDALVIKGIIVRDSR